MSLGSFLANVDDRLNPIVVKELRQAVQGRFVTVVLMIFLVLQLVFLGLYLLLGEVGGAAADLEADHGRTAFSVLQAILLGTCMIFLPAYAGIRLGAERSDTNVDLLFITTLRPRAIIAGKFWASLILGILIFSACAPFMTFTYLLRGVDLMSILLVLGIDFLVVIATVQLAIFLGAVPGNRIIKSLLGVVGLGVLVFVFAMTLSTSMFLLLEGASFSLMDSPEFWAVFCTILAGGVTVFGLLFTWSVAMISPPSANKALPSRVFLLFAVPATALVVGYWNYRSRLFDVPLNAWLIFMGVVSCLQIMIAINEREYWTPRVGRTIPRHWWLRLPAFFLYSGAAGGLLFALALFGMTWSGFLAIRSLAPATFAGSILYSGGGPFAPARFLDVTRNILHIVSLFGLYFLAYSMTAVLCRRLMYRRVRIADTWLLMVFILAVGCAVPLVLSYTLHGQHWRYAEQYYWFLPNPIAAAIAVGENNIVQKQVFLLFVSIWAGLVTLANVPWFWKQVLRFRPFVSNPAVARAVPVLAVAAPAESTRTAP
jgi:hypothetical protein